MTHVVNRFGIGGAEIDGWLSELTEFIGIPSVSADPERAGDIRTAAEWVRRRIQMAGGEADVEMVGDSPLTIGEVRASHESKTAPTVLLYGHFDVQPPDPLDLWDTDPFSLDVRDGWIYGRGTADDKGQLFMLLEAVRRLAREGTLPVNVRFACDGEEEIEGPAIGRWITQDARGADACLIYDSAMLDRDTPTFAVGCRGLLYVHIKVRTGERDLHSGQYGGAALNASHALIQTLASVLPVDGQLPPRLRFGTVSNSAQQFEAIEQRTPGAHLLSTQGGKPAYPDAARDFYLRTTAEPSLDVNGIEVGSPYLMKTVLPVVAEANLSMRLAWRQDPATIAAELETLLREAAPDGAEIELQVMGSSAAAFQDPGERVFVLGQDAVEATLGTRPLLYRGGGSIPIFPALVERGIPTIITGFDLPDGNIHSPNERLSLDLLPAGVACACAMLQSFARLSADAQGTASPSS
jgi:acetylornithine deacetylase/succinyl-diaminopimelate desuccinylase-like protein